MRPAAMHRLAGLAVVVAAGVLFIPGSPSPGRRLPAPLAVAGGARDREPTSLAAPDRAMARRLVNGVPTAFVPNQGQWPGAFRYEARFGGATVFLEERGWVLSLVGEPPATPRRQALAPEMLAGPEMLARREALEREPMRGAALRMRFVGADMPALVAGDRLAGVHNYFLGNDPARWKSGVPRHAAVTYGGLYPGVDVEVYGKDGHLEYDLLVQPGADLGGVEIEVEGANGLRLEPDGTLVIDTVVGPVRQKRPATFGFDENGARREIACDYELRGATRFGFEASDWSGEGPLLVDPGLLWSTFLGGNRDDEVYALSVDASGVVTVTGVTGSPGYPTTAGAWNTIHNSPTWNDVFVTRLDPSQPASQQLLYSTFVGGASDERAFALAVDTAGVVTIAGFTISANYPTTSGAWDTSFNGPPFPRLGNVFVTRLDPSQPASQQLLYSTFVGREAVALGLSVDASGAVTITGTIGSPGDYPTTPGAWDTTFNGQSDVFVTCLDPSRTASQQLVYSTFVGGAGYEGASKLWVAPSGVVTIAGQTEAPGYPTTPGAWDTTFNGPLDVFVTRLDPLRPASQQLVYSTLVGGEGGFEGVRGLSVDTSGIVTITGFTESPTYPTTASAWDTTYNGGLSYGGDVFVTRLDPSQPASQQLLYSTFVGGANDDLAIALAVGASGIVMIAGSTTSPTYPTTLGAWDTTFNGQFDAFVTRLDPSRPSSQQLLYSTFVGGASNDIAYALSAEHSGIVTMAGVVHSWDYPTTPGAWDTTYNGSNDSFVTRLDMLPVGAARYGASSAGCNGPLAAGVTSMPRIGNASFALTCTNAPPNAPGIVPLAGAGLQAPVAVLGIDLWVDPRQIWVVTSAASDARGAADLPLPLPLHRYLVGLQLHGQFVWFGPNAPAPCPPLGFSASSALEVTIQP